MSRVREKQLQKRKQETLDAAIRRLMERGYANLNMDELADEVGLSKPTLYQYFNSKDELISQALVHMFEKMGEHLSETSEDSPLDRLEQFLRMMLKARNGTQSEFGLVDIEAMRSIVFRHPQIIERLRETRSKLVEVVRQGQEQGEIDPGIPGWVVVNTMLSLQGAIHNHFMKAEPHLSPPEMAEAVEGVIRMFRRGVSAAIHAPD